MNTSSSQLILPPEVTCIKVCHLRRNGFQSLEQWKSACDSHLYIGRNVPYVRGAIASKWMNPYPTKKYGLQQSLEMYESHVRRTPELWDRLIELNGMILGCWCQTDECHGYVLRRLVFEKYGSQDILRPDT